MGNNLNIFASANIEGGTYDKINIFGSAKFNGKIIANQLHVNGSAHFNSELEIERVSINGSCKFMGHIVSKSIHINGATVFDESVSIESLKINGASTFNGKVDRAQSIEINGAVDVKTLEADSIVIRGAIKCHEQLNADIIKIELNENKTSEINEMVGETIIVKPNKNFFWKKSRGLVKVKIIEGDTLELEGVEAEVVRGKNVKVGPNCTIESVEYSDTYECDPKSTVTTSKQV